VAAAIELIEERGVAALTMRDVALHLGSATSAAYRHVADKDALLMLAADQILGQIEVPEEGDWYQRLVTLECNIRSVLGRYPGMSRYILQDNPLTANARRHTNAFFGILREAGLGEEDAAKAFFSIYMVMAGDLVIGRHVDVTQAEAQEQFIFALNALLRGLGLEVPPTARRASSTTAPYRRRVRGPVSI